MIQLSISTERLLLIAILGVLLFNVLIKRCSSYPDTQEQPQLTVERDTLWQTKTDTFTINTVRYKTVYVNPENVREIISEHTNISPPETYTEARTYQDTLSNEDITIYSYNLIDGTLLDSELSYELNVPREITVTNTITHPPRFRSGLYLFGEVGGNTQSLDNISFGLQYNRKGKWFTSYRYNLNSLQGNTHNVGLGVRLFK